MEPSQSTTEALPAFMPQIPNSDLAALTSKQKGFVVSIRSIAPETRGDALRDIVAEMFPPAQLFAQEICDMPSVWIELRNFLDARGARLQQHSSRRVILTLAHGLYTEAEDRASSIENANLIVAAGRRVRQDITAVPDATMDQKTKDVPSQEHISEERVAHNVAMRLKDSEKKFSGDIGECWHEFVDDYNQVSRDYKLSATQKLQYLHNILRNDASRFFLDRVQPYANTYVQAVDMIDKEYNSPVRQTRVKNYLSSLRVSTFVEEGTEISQALAKIYKTILKMSRQVPRTFQGDAHRIEFLRHAVIGFPWAHDPLSRIASHQLGFQQLYGELEAALQLDKEARLIMSRDEAARSSKSADPIGVNYAGQARYNRSQRNPRPTQRKDPLLISGCFNCDDPNHLIKDCPKPKNIAKATARRLEYYKKKRTANGVHMVLAEICHQLDDTNAATEESEGEDDLSIFQCIIDEAKEGTDATINFSSINKVCHEHVGRVDVNFAIGTGETFEGACVDSGAQLTCIGARQARRYCMLMNITYETSDQELVFKFGDARHCSLGTMPIQIPVSDYGFIEIDAHIVDVDVPLLLGLDTMTKLEMILDFAKDTVTSKLDSWKIPLIRKLGHAYITWSPSVMYTDKELRKIHRHFHHPQAERLYALMKRANPNEATAETLKELQEVQSNCDVCQREADEPQRFRVSMPNDDVVFNRVVSLDLMKINRRTVLHAVDRDTKFSAACFTNGESTIDIWEAFLSIWVERYIGYPAILALDQGPQFTSREWESLMKDADIKPHHSGVESHNALGNGERYHSFLRRLYDKVRADNVNLSEERALSLAVKACNDTAGPKGLVPTLLVFGTMPRMPLRPHELPGNVSRLKSMIAARKEATQLIAQSRIATAIRRSVPAAADSAIQIGEEVLMYREKPIGKWVGPFIVEQTDGKNLTLNTGDRTIRASLDKVKSYKARFKDHDADTQQNHDHDDAISKEREGLERLLGLTIDSTEGDGNQDEIQAFVAKIIEPNDPRGMENDFIEAKIAEAEGLIKRKIWRKIKRANVPDNAIILGGRFVLTLKNHMTPAEVAKARYVAQGHNDPDKEFIVHDTIILRISSIRIILSCACLLLLRLFSHDVTQAYSQSKDKLTRKIYVKPKLKDLEIFGISDDELFELIFPLYGLCDAGDYWGLTIEDHLTNDIGMKPLTGDGAVFVRRNGDEIEGITGSYVDDCLNAGNADFEQTTEKTLQRFESKPRVYDDFDFFGTQIRTIAPGKFSMTQRNYSNNLSFVDLGCTFEEFRRHRALFSWMTHTRPDISCYANRACQVSQKTFCKGKIRELNKGIKIVKNTADQGLTFEPLDKQSIEMRVYADASFATNDDLSSQIGYLVMICDKSNKCHIIDFSSKKSRRTVRSIMAGEVCAFMDAFDAAYMLRSDMQEILGVEIPLLMFTDSKQLFDAMTKGRRTTEKRLMIDVSAARQAYRRFEISAVGLVRGEDNPADALSKIAGNQALRRVLVDGMDETPVVLWIERTAVQSSDKDSAAECERI